MNTPDNTAFEVTNLNAWYGDHQVIHDISFTIRDRQVTAIIGPSGCGKSTFIRCLNRINDLVEGFRLDGRILFEGQDLYGPGVDPIEIRARVGMVFQKPNPFPKSIYENVACGPRLWGVKKRAELDRIVEESLKKAALWDEVKDKLRNNGMALSGGQQQRLCIARAIAIEPEVILMDEPCSALDPRGTTRIEDLIVELRKDYTIVIVTHNMQQAARVSDITAFLYEGFLVETGDTQQIFTNPKDKRTEDYITGRFG